MDHGDRWGALAGQVLGLGTTSHRGSGRRGTTIGNLAFILHAHLPWVRQSAHTRYLEESWLHEAIAECYLPLLHVLRGWARDGVPARITVSLSPTLVAMLDDPLLRGRFARRLEEMEALGEQERFRTGWLGEFKEAAEFHADRVEQLAGLYREIRGDIAGAFADLAKAGVVELITTSATHALLPFLLDQPGSLRAQIVTGVNAFRGRFGFKPAGFWVPECAYAPALETALKAGGVRWFVLETHGLNAAEPRPPFSPLTPALTPSGLGVMARDPESAHQVWSRQGGYPGDPAYREFYRDVGFDLDLDYVEPCLPAPKVRGFTGFKYHRVTGATNEKQPYRRVEALAKVQGHAEHFIASRLQQLDAARQAGCPAPLVTAPYDAELFGHWWFEGPEFLDAVARTAMRDGRLKLVTPTDHLQTGPELPVVQPAASSWGEGGDWRLWLNSSNAWIQEELLAADRAMSRIVATCVAADELVERALRQMTRELLLAQASDWPFMQRTGTNSDFARSQVELRLARFRLLERKLASRQLDSAEIASIEAETPIFTGTLAEPASWIDERSR